MRLINSEGQIVDAKVCAKEGASANRNENRIEFGGLAAILCAALCGISVPAAFFAWHQADKAETEARMLEYYVNEVDGKLIHAGFIEPRERWSPEKRAEMAKKLEEAK